MKRKRLNKKRLFNFFMIIIALVLFALVAFKVVSDLNKDNAKVEKKQLDIIEPYGYKLDDRDTSTYKKYFNELKEVLKEDPIDEEKNAELLTKLFITDFYTLDNRLTSTDIGSLEFIHEAQVDNFILNAEETMYKTVESDLYGERKQELPVVKEVTVESIEETTYTYNNNEYDAYRVTASWTYKKDLGYEDEGVFILMKDKDKLNVVEKVSKEEDTDE